MNSTGEQYSVTTNPPLKAKKEDFHEAFEKMAFASEERLRIVNTQVAKINDAEAQETPANKVNREALKGVAAAN